MCADNSEPLVKRVRSPLTPITDVTLLSGNILRSINSSKVSIYNVGQKAFGLASLPTIWRTPFFVIDGEISPTEKAINRALNRFDLIREEKIIIRSSSTDESLHLRGAYDSDSCSPGKVRETLQHLQSQHATISASENHQPKIFWVVQQLIPTRARGHLSNERRLFKADRDWLAEIEASTGQSHESQSIAIRPWRDARIPTPDRLSCPYKANYINCLGAVARWAFARVLRAHFEWIWDGRTIHIVQVDEAKDGDHGVDPESIIAGAASHSSPTQLNLFERVSQEDFEAYGKLANTRIYRSLGYKTVDFFRLSDPSAIEAILQGNIQKPLQDDLAELMHSPLIIRTDGLNIPLDKRIMLPRSDELRTSADAERWLITNFRHEITKLGLEDCQLCLIAHNFVPAIASAWCQAHPDSRRVRIESLWGIPEGLYWHAHDVFDVDTLNNVATENRPPRRLPVRKRLRYKSRFIAPNNVGDWVLHITKPGPDWSSSIKKAEWVDEIAWMSRRIAHEAGYPVVVMWFIGIPAGRSHHEVMPWWHERWKPEAMELKAAPRHKNPTSTEIRITTQKDWEKLKERCAAGHPVTRVYVNPDDPALVRNPEFAKDLGALGKTIGFIVELSGGILSHAYYLLNTSGCVVECSDLYAVDEEQVEFNKLVRDNIPSMIQAKGETVEVVKLEGEALVECLKRKVVEEAFEVFDSKNTRELEDEIADLIEVIDQLKAILMIDDSAIIEKRQSKNESRGGFTEGLMLQRTKLGSSVISRPPENSLSLELSASQPTRIISHSQDLPVQNEDVNVDLRHSKTGLAERQVTVTIPAYSSETMISRADLDIRTLPDKTSSLEVQASIERSSSDLKIKIRLIPAPIQKDLDFD